MRRGEIPHFSAACEIDIYSMRFPPSKSKKALRFRRAFKMRIQPVELALVPTLIDRIIIVRGANNVNFPKHFQQAFFKFDGTVDFFVFYKSSGIDCFGDFIDFIAEYRRLLPVRKGLRSYLLRSRSHTCEVNFNGYSLQ